MILSLALALLSIQPTAADTGRGGGRGVPALRVWLSDSVLDLGHVAQVFVRPRYTGYLTVLHADAEGHVRILYPVSPEDQIPVQAGATFQVSSGVEGRAFSVNARGTGIVLAAWSATPFTYDDLRYGDRWDYDNALLLQPSAGNGFAALLDIADRIAGDRPYGYDLAVYGTPGARAVRPNAPPAPCKDCLTRHYVSRPSGDNTVATPTYAVDCSNTTLVDSFCGVSDNRIYYSYVDQSQNYYEENQAPSNYPMSYDYPYYDYGYYDSYYPFYGHGGGGRLQDGRRGHDFHRSTTPAQAYIRPIGLQQVQGGRAPTPPIVRYRPTISVRQPYAPSRPDRSTADPPASTGMAGGVAGQSGFGGVAVIRRPGVRPIDGVPIQGGGPGGEVPGGAWGGFVGAPPSAGAVRRNAPPFGNTIPQPFGNTIPQSFGNRIAPPFGGGVEPAPRPAQALPVRGGGGGGGGHRR